jgi:hypothetical protein
MSEELINNEVQKSESEKIEKVKVSLEKIKSKQSKFLFCIPESHSPAASIYEIYFHATVVKNMGYDVIALVEKAEYVPPVWIEKELTAIKHLPLSDPKLTVGPEDVMVIPDVYSNIMEQTKNLPCLRVGLLQSIDYMINGLIPSYDWKRFGINDIITTSKSIQDFIETFYGKNKFSIRVYNVGIPEYFEKDTKPQKPIISIVGRNPNEISKFAKLFYNKFPQYNWITFDSMLTKSKPPVPLRRVDFAKRLKENCAAVWVDRISSFGTFPLECMKSSVIPICLKPDIMPEYLIERDETGKPAKVVDGCGVWTDNFYDLPMLLGEVITKFLDDSINDKLYNSMNKIASKYNQEDAKKQLTDIYGDFILQRTLLLESAVNNNI